MPYLDRLGVSHLYSSPLFVSRPGSRHGYDVIDPTRIDPELGGEAALDALGGELDRRGMGLVLDIVPNHMAASPDNPWWASLLAHGRRSPYARFFDVDWDRERDGRLLLPILAEPYGSELAAGRLRLVADAASGVRLAYYERRLPLTPRSLRPLLAWRLPERRRELGDGHPAVAALRDLLSALGGAPGTSRPKRWATPGPAPVPPPHDDDLARRLASLCADEAGEPSPRRLLDEALRAFNASPVLLDRVIRRQPYRPAVWRLAAEAVNYRRFFDVADLAALRQEDEAVFTASHRLVLRLVRDGTVDGLRIDHVDGLRDPAGYLRRLQRGSGRRRPAGGVAAAVGGGGEDPRRRRGAAGVVAGGRHHRLRLPELADRRLRGPGGPARARPPLRPLHRRGGGLRRGALPAQAPGAGGALPRRPGRAGRGPRHAGGGGPRGARPAPVAARPRPARGHRLPAGLPHLHRPRTPNRPTPDRVRTINRSEPPTESEPAPGPPLPISPEEPAQRASRRAGSSDPHPAPLADSDLRYLDRALAEARQRTPAGPLTPLAFDFLSRVLHLDPPPELAGELPRWRDFVARWQQLTGPAMAKGLEDTALYVYNRLISLNAVGGEPEGIDRPGDAAAFHRRNRERRERWPYGMTTTSTHDAKRSEDVRARINVLSELSAEWGDRVDRWTALNRQRKRAVGGHLVPDANLEIFLYQTLVGAWPLGDAPAEGFAERLEEYLLKAVREAKVHTSWSEPDEAFEAALIAFARSLLDTAGSNAFLDELLGFVSVVSWYGAWSSLSQVVLKVAAPGVPDVYQGSELWDLSLVDPDNRRPVDWALRRRHLDALAARCAAGKGDAGDDPAGESPSPVPPELLAELMASWRDGRVKLWVTWRALALRRRRRELFLEGSYLPLEAAGEHAACILAFARRHGDRWLLAVAPRWLSRVASADGSPLGEAWGDTAVRLPAGSPAGWSHALDGRDLGAENGTLRVADLFRHLPVALLTG